ncbi:hypothetical protein FHR83_005677 [Actinoplanes campanulatus]|uniref:Uncharacterized protein n=1 Tax=Actinoplanes campanulatus TaxID=113559 RepID=A0A7W5FH06_9ACTN|nr:hypothetical protein [Actinoplanes campanulatus]
MASPVGRPSGRLMGHHAPVPGGRRPAPGDEAWTVAGQLEALAPNLELSRWEVAVVRAQPSLTMTRRSLWESYAVSLIANPRRFPVHCQSVTAVDRLRAVGGKQDGMIIRLHFGIGSRKNSVMGQGSLFSRAQTAEMRDPSKARNHSPEREEFRRMQQRRRAFGLERRHAEKLRRLHPDPATLPAPPGGSGPAARPVDLAERPQPPARCAPDSRRPSTATDSLHPPATAPPTPEAPHRPHAAISPLHPMARPSTVGRDGPASCQGCFGRVGAVVGVSRRVSAGCQGCLGRVETAPTASRETSAGPPCPAARRPVTASIANRRSGFGCARRSRSVALCPGRRLYQGIRPGLSDGRRGIRRDPPLSHPPEPARGTRQE